MATSRSQLLRRRFLATTRATVGAARLFLLVGILTSGVYAPFLAAQQAPPHNARDLSGLWVGGGQGFGSSDISQNLLPGEEVSLTSYGAERYRANDLSKFPGNICLPYGPTRAMHSLDPQEWVQTPDRLVILFEQMSHYRIIYTDGRPHADDALDYPSWMGHSTGRWEGDELVVDTIGIDDRSWLDSRGFEHSDRLHVVERYRLLDDDTLRLTFTVEDPMFFTRPFTYSLDKHRADAERMPRILPQICNENEQDSGHILPLPPAHENPPTFPD